MLTITNFPRGVRGLRPAWLCEEMGVPYRVTPIPYPVPAGYRARNLLGQVPFLEDGEIAITESVAMLLHIAQAHGPTPLLPAPGDPTGARVLQMAIFGEATLGAPVNALLVDRFAVPEADRNRALSRMLRDRVEQAIAFAAHILGDRHYFAGEQITVADISVVTSFGMWCGPLGGALPPSLEAYRARAACRPAYARASKAIGNG
ncbi:MAG TPA: glutathione S-transferase family protein [Rhizomicrobium sp.]|nr:glutathione S-transferase family protein [Rhizomicrobium sp.]